MDKWRDMIRSGAEGMVWLRMGLVALLLLGAFAVLPVRERADDIAGPPVKPARTLPAVRGAVEEAALTPDMHPVPHWPGSAFVFSPHFICNLMAPRGGSLRWGASQLFPGQWECLSQENPQDAAEENDPFTLFAMARGAKPDEISYVRIGLSILQSEAQEAAISQFAALARNIARALGAEDLPAEIEQALGSLKPARAKRDDMNFSFVAEKMTANRFHLIIQLPRETDFFKPAPNGPALMWPLQRPPGSTTISVGPLLSRSVVSVGGDDDGDGF